jgi:hypothetical protein
VPVAEAGFWPVTSPSETATRAWKFGDSTNVAPRCRSVVSSANGTTASSFTAASSSSVKAATSLPATR